MQLELNLKQNTAVVLYSGGLGSFAAAYLAKQKYGKVFLYFNDTQIEDPDLYRFLQESSAWLGLELIEDSDGRDPWKVFEDTGFIGNTRIDPCSRVLKRERSQKYIRSNFPESTTVVFGIDWTEIHRIEKVKKNGYWKPYKVSAPLAEGLIDKSDLVADLLQKSAITPPALYGLGFAHNNCGGFCVKAGLAQFKLLWEKLPLRYLYHEKRQEEIMARNPKLKPFLRKTINKKLRYITLKEYRTKYLNELTEQEEFDFGGCGCAV